MTGPLATLGWDPTFAAAFAALPLSDAVPGRVAVEDKHAYLVFTELGELQAQASGRLLHQALDRAALPKVGDWVSVSPIQGEPKGTIHAVLPRRTQLARKVPGREIQVQILAANVDLAFVVQALDQSFNRQRLERFLAMVREGNVRPVVLLNKSDLCDHPESRVTEFRASLGDTPVLAVSARTGRGVSALAGHLRPGETAVFIGSSGVGKSSLINRLYGEDIQPTIEVRDNDAKGRHTTSWRELIPLPDGTLVIDTPGLREFHLWTADAGLPAAFPDIDALAVRCHFRNCSHTVEARCAVRAAVDSGELDAARLVTFHKLQIELAQMTTGRRQHDHLAPARARRSQESRRPRAHPDDLEASDAAD